MSDDESWGGWQMSGEGDPGTLEPEQRGAEPENDEGVE